MTSDLKHLVWDTCIFGRYLTADPPDFVPDIEAFFQDFRHSRKTVYFSSIVFAEIGRPLLKRGGSLDIMGFAKSLGSNFTIVDANANIMSMAGEIHAERPVNPNPGSETNRVIGLARISHRAAIYSNVFSRGEQLTS
jgi:hypothetical protein